MSKPTQLSAVLHRYNQGCSSYHQALDFWKSGKMPGYENALRSAATETIGALELAIKVYLRTSCRNRITEEDWPKLKQPNFHHLMSLMQKYADPPLETETINSLYDYRQQLRNPAEHNASIPPSEELHAAIQKVREMILMYLRVGEDQLKSVGEPITPDSDIQRLKAEYFDTLRSRYEYMDLGGISPRVGNKVVKIRTEDLFVPLHVTEDVPLFESFAEELFMEAPDSLQESISTSENSSGSDEPLVTEHPARSQVVASEDETLNKRPQRSGRVKQEMTHLLDKSKVVILGDPGSGKTTVGRYVAYSIATGKSSLVGKHLKQHIPIIVRAADYASLLKESPNLSFYSYVTDKHSDRFGKLFESALSNGQCIIIIDGLDEVPDSEGRITTSRRIEAFVAEFETNRFLVTSRIVGYRQTRLSGSFTHVMLSEFDEKEILQFLEQWYKAIEVEAEAEVAENELERRASHLWRAVNSNAGIRKLASNPLLLTIIALANWRGSKLPNRRAELYQIATETLIENWPLQQRGITLDSEEILEILDPIAFHIFSSGKNNLITRYELRPLFESKIREVRGVTRSEARTLSRELLQTIGEHTGFFLEKGLDQSGQSVYGFLHLTFAEYLAARYLAEQWSGGELDLAEYAHNARWREVLLLMAGYVGSWSTAPPTQLVNNILELGSPHEQHLHRDLLLATEILSDNVRVKRDLQDKIVSRLISLALSTPHELLWHRIAHQLGVMSQVLHLGSPIEQLSLLTTDDVNTRARKAMLLHIVGRESDELLPTLLHGWSVDEFIRRLAELSIVPLRMAMSIEQREGATHILSIRHGNFAIPATIASKILAFASPICDIDALVKLPRKYEEDSEPIYLVECQTVLRLEPSELAPLIATGDYSTASLVNTALQATGCHLTVIKKLLDLAISSKVEATQVEAFRALTNLYEHLEYTDVLPSELTDMVRRVALVDENPIIRAEAFTLLFTLFQDLEEGFRELQPAFEDPSGIVRLSAARLYRKGHSLYGPQESLAFRKEIQKLLSDPSQDVRCISALALIRTEHFSKEDVPTLLRELLTMPVGDTNVGNTNGSQPQILLQCLLRLGDEVHPSETMGAIDARIKEIIQSDATTDEVVRDWIAEQNLAEVFGTSRIRPREELAETISTLFDSRNAKTRRKAILLWSRTRPESISTTRLLPLLKDDDVKVRAAAFQSLRTTDFLHPQVVDLALQSIVEDNSEVADSAASVLSELAEPSLRQGIINRVAHLIHNNPDNKHAYAVFWELSEAAE